jgi:hypothetical protein
MDRALLTPLGFPITVRPVFNKAAKQDGSTTSSTVSALAAQTPHEPSPY